MENEIKLFRKHVHGIGTWRVYSEGNVIHLASTQVEGGKEVHFTEVVETNLSGRSLEEQVKLRINSRVSRMADKGYKETIEQAQFGATNQLNLLRPMLANPIQRVKRINYDGAILQPKLDGHRCLVTRHDGQIIAYSRQGKLIPSIRHITSVLDKVLPEGVTLDGEAYCHGVALQTIGSWIKREQEDTLKLNYVVYDLISKDPFQERLGELMTILSPILMSDDKNSPIRSVGNYVYTGDKYVRELFDSVRVEGYEGLILRTNDRGYEPGVRSQSLIKIKKFFDDEFKVLSVRPSKDGWGICACEARNGRTFDVSAPGNMIEKKRILDEKEKYVGEYLTVEYSVLTNDGIPFHPCAVRWVNEI